MLRVITKTLQPAAIQYGFASAAAIDYYSLLGLDRAATEVQVR